MPRLEERVAALEQFFAGVDLGDWGPQDGSKVPWWVAIRVTPHEDVIGAVQLGAQAKALQGAQGEGLNRVMAEIIDEWCGTPPRPPGPHRHWGAIVEQLGALGDRYPSGSALGEAAFELARRVVNRAHEVRKQANSR